MDEERPGNTGGGAEFVLDGFHIQEYIRRRARLAGDTEEKR